MERTSSQQGVEVQGWGWLDGCHGREGGRGGRVSAPLFRKQSRLSKVRGWLLLLLLPRSFGWSNVLQRWIYFLVFLMTLTEGGWCFAPLPRLSGGVTYLPLPLFWTIIASVLSRRDGSFPSPADTFHCCGLERRFILSKERA